uniref:Uncharacterized protein n=1 Tax=Picea glauca TaxID=3330 RepID=A0A124GP36_PICGL|nr:hypothetical protein ABT39_MTgene565 [Picea glauca]
MPMQQKREQQLLCCALPERQQLCPTTATELPLLQL